MQTQSGLGHQLEDVYLDHIHGMYIHAFMHAYIHMLMMAKKMYMKMKMTMTAVRTVVVG